MKYNISKATAPVMPNLGKGTKICKFSSLRPRKTCRNPLFRCFSPFLAQISAARNFNTPTLLGRSYAAKWPISWPIRAAIRVN